MLRRNIGLFLCLLVVTLGNAFAPPIVLGQRPPFLVERHGTWRYFAAQETPPKNWQSLEFNDESWKQGRAGFGYADEDDTTVLNDMLNNYQSVYVRATFMVDDPKSIASLYLYVNYDDGFIAYINGKEVVAAQAERKEGTLNVGLHEAIGYETFVVDNANEILIPGKNILAIEGHNRDLASSDFTLDPFLVTEKITFATQLIGPAEMKADLAEFERRLEDQSSYRTLRGYDYREAIKRLSDTVTDQTKVWEFALNLKKIVMQLGDCHADVLSPHPIPHDGVLPLRPAMTRDGIVALALNRKELLDAEHPYLESIDGVPLDKWLERASLFVAQGSPQLIQHRSLNWLVQIDLLRHEMGLAVAPTATLGLRSADGTMRKEQLVRVTRQMAIPAQVQYGPTRVLDSNILYLRIAEMDNRLIDSVIKSMRDAHQTRGMVIDVRDNLGGTYAMLQALYGFFVPDDAPPYVTNIAAYRLSSQFMPDHLYYRPTFPAEWEGWHEDEQGAIRRAAELFRPEWVPPDGTMSPWHYMILSRTRGGREYYYYDKPVVVLCNPGSFSATDGFLSALADLPQVTLMGQASGGGSGAVRRFVLPNTGIVVGLSSMASYRANGQTFDGQGIKVDVEVLPIATDFLGQSDVVLNQALQHLTNR